MADANDLWPTDLIDTETVAPVAILREQAELLAQKTRGLLAAEVRTGSPDTGLIQHDFIIVAPTLGYRYLLFDITHQFGLYPLAGNSFLDRQQRVQITDEEELRDWIRVVLASPFTKRLVSGLAAQIGVSRAMPPPLETPPA